MNIGIIGAGNIAEKMAVTINQLDGIFNYAIASRDLQKAKVFQEKFGVQKAYGSYEELLQDEEVDLVYIATVHSTHYPIMLLCLQYRKPVLCEKIFTTSLRDTIDIYKKFEEKGLFVAEALWTSFLPSRKIIEELLYKKKVIGEVVGMESWFRIPIQNVERIKRKDLGGGAVMDIGVYPISFTFRTLGFDYKSVNIYGVECNEYGADLQEIIEFEYDKGIKAVCVIETTSSYPLTVTICGEKGKMVINHVNCPVQIEVFDNNNQLVECIECAPSLGGFEYQVLACKKALEEGKLECSEWSHANSIAVSQIVDKTLKMAENINLV